jgi:hypothetical protein
MSEKALTDLPAAAYEATQPLLPKYRSIGPRIDPRIPLEQLSDSQVMERFKDVAGLNQMAPAEFPVQHQMNKSQIRSFYEMYDFPDKYGSAKMNPTLVNTRPHQYYYILDLLRNYIRHGPPDQSKQQAVELKQWLSVDWNRDRPLLFLDGNYFEDNTERLLSVMSEALNRYLLPVLFATTAMIDLIRGHFLRDLQSGAIIVFTRFKGERTYTEDIFEAVRYIPTNYPICVYIQSALLTLSKLTYREWLPAVGLYRRHGSEKDQRRVMIMYDDGRSYQFIAAKEFLRSPSLIYPSLEIKSYCLRIRASSFDFKREPSGDQTRDLFLSRYPTDRCLNEIFLTYGVNGIAFTQWIQSNFPFGDGPEVVRIYNETRIATFSAKPNWLITDFTQLQETIAELNPTEVGFLLIDQDYFSRFHTEKYPSRIDQVIFLVGNDITYRKVTPDLFRIRRSDLYFIIDCDSANQSSDREIVNIANHLIQNGAKSVEVISNDNDLSRMFDVLHQRTGQRITVRKPTA